MRLFIFFFAALLFGQSTGTVRDNGVTIQYEQSLRAVAEEVARLYPEVRSGLERTFGITIAFEPTVLLIKDRENFRQLVGNDLVVAVAIPQDSLIVIDNSRMKTHPFTMEVTLKHELCHLLLYHYVGGKGLPRWLNEGIAQWVTGGVSELMGEDKDLLKQASISGRFIPLEDLKDTFPSSSQPLQLAYQESRSVTGYIVSKFGQEGMLRILDALRDGRGIDLAVQEALSLSLGEMESNWQDFLRTRYTWFTYMSSHLFEIIFAFGAIVLIYGFVRFLIIKRNYKDEEQSIDDESPPH